MREALLAARSVEGRTGPRPPVGAVVLRDGEIVGRGATAPPYGPHAEALALSEAGAAARGADLYVTLEPCCLTRHTPPCTEAIIAAGIRRVFVAALDPNPAVHGQGLQQLQSAGIETLLLEDEPEAAELVRPFATFITQGRAYVTAKWAMSLDGKIATHTRASAWISGPAARLWTHDLRDRVDAIIVGAGTARHDDPRLTVRLAPEQRRIPRTERPRPPLRVVLAGRSELPAHLALLRTDEAPTLVIVSEVCPREQLERLQAREVEVEQVAADRQGRPDICAALRALAERGIMHALLEGGAALLGSAFDQRCIDHVAAFIAPILIGGREAPTPLEGCGLAELADVPRLQRERTIAIDEDILLEGDVCYDAVPSMHEQIKERISHA